jgi:hypothetical protein
MNADESEASNTSAEGPERSRRAVMAGGAALMGGTLVAMPAPAINPTAGTKRLFLDSSTSQVSVMDSDGHVTSLEA